MTKPKYDLNNTTPPIVASFVSKKGKKDKKKKSPGGGFGPANAPKVTGGDGFTSGYGTDADPVVFGGGMAGGIAESAKKFSSFLESLRTESNGNLIDIVKKGFQSCI